MKYVGLQSLKDLIRKYNDEVKEFALKYVESKEFRQAKYNDMTARQLLRVISNEDHEGKRAALICLLNYKMDKKIYVTMSEKRHFHKFLND